MGSSVWWLGSPNVDNTNNVYNVTASGTLNNNNANNTYGVSLDCLTQINEESNLIIEETSFQTRSLKLCRKHNFLANKNHIRKLPINSVELSKRYDDFPIQELIKSAFQCSHGVMWKDSVLKWRLNYLKFCRQLHKQLKNKTYKMANYQKFYINYPKKRQIISILFKDRVVHRTMCNNGVYRDLTKGNIYDNGACQINKGTSFTLRRLKIMLHRYYQKYGNKGYVLRLDIHKFFQSIPHDQLIDLVNKKITNKRYAQQIINIINSFEGDKGIGLGCQISQLLAVAYLSDFDHIMKQKFKIKCYSRYSDDIVIIHQDKQYLMQMKKFIIKYLNKKGLQLNPKSTLHKLQQGIKYLKFNFILTKTGKVVCFKQKKQIKIAIRRFNKMMNLINRNAKKLTKINLINSYNSWISCVYTKYKKLIFNRIENKIQKFINADYTLFQAN